MSKSQEAKLINRAEIAGASGIKLVKNASVFQKDGIFFALHYQTVIFAYDPKTRQCEAMWHCSTTSDRQIRHCLRFFGLSEEEAINIYQGKKWGYGGF